MITRPLDLSSRLRPTPRSYDFLFFVNAGLIALMFTLFGSRFVLSPGLGVDFVLPVMAGASEGAAPTDVVIAIKRKDMALVEGAVLNFDSLRVWLVDRAAGRHDLRLLVQLNASIPTGDLTEIVAMAKSAGFQVQVAAEPPAR